MLFNSLRNFKDEKKLNITLKLYLKQEFSFVTSFPISK